MDIERDWQVLLIGGASGVGKTSVSYRIAQHFGVGLVEVDDVQIVLERMTTPEQYPELHLWRTRPEEALRMDEDAVLEHMRRQSKTLSLALEAVIGNHIETRTPVVLEGDFILPSLAVRPSYGDVEAQGLVRAIFLYEPEEQQLLQNFRTREGEEQPRRARISRRHSEWLRLEAEQLGLPCLKARPYETVLERVLSLLEVTADA